MTQVVWGLIYLYLYGTAHVLKLVVPRTVQLYDFVLCTCTSFSTVLFALVH